MRSESSRLQTTIPITPTILITPTIPTKTTRTTPRILEKVGTYGKGVENGLHTAGHMEPDTTQVQNAVERKMEIIMLQLWPTRKVIPQHIVKIPDWSV